MLHIYAFTHMAQPARTHWLTSVSSGSLQEAYLLCRWPSHMHLCCFGARSSAGAGVPAALHELCACQASHTADLPAQGRPLIALRNPSSLRCHICLSCCACLPCLWLCSRRQTELCKRLRLWDWCPCSLVCLVDMTECGDITNRHKIQRVKTI